MGRGGTANGLLAEGSNEAEHAGASPTTHVAGSSPTILFHGTEDTTISAEGSVRYHQMLQDAGIASELHIFAGVPHVFDSNPEFARAAAQAADFFIDRHVLNPRTYPPFGGGRGA
jgi:acetyl esterase/lipase